MGASGSVAEVGHSRPTTQHGQRSGQSLADAVASTRGCSGAILLSPEGRLLAVSPLELTFPAAAVTALADLLTAAAAGACTVLLPQHTVVARRLGDGRILAGLLEPGGDSAPVRGMLEGLLPVTLAMLQELASPPPTRMDAREALEPVVAEAPPEPAPAGVPPITASAAPAPPPEQQRVPAPAKRRRRRASVLAVLVALVVGMAIGAALWAWASSRPGVLGSSVATAAPSSQPSAAPVPSPAPTPAPAPPTPTTPAVPPLQLTYAGDLMHGASGEGVRALQARLRQLRYFVYPEETGYFGDATYGAVYTFQRDRGLPTTGVADQATVAALNACDQRCNY